MQARGFYAIATIATLPGEALNFQQDRLALFPGAISGPGAYAMLPGHIGGRKYINPDLSLSA